MFIAFLYMFMFTGKKCILATFMPINLYLVSCILLVDLAGGTEKNGSGNPPCAGKLVD